MSKSSKSVSPVPDASPVKDDTDYEAENAFNTLLKAHEHRADPKMMERVKKHAGRKLKALTGMHNEINSISDMRATKEKKFGPQGKCPECGSKMVKGDCPTCM